MVDTVAAPERGIGGNTLKYIAAAAMLIDHVALMFLSGIPAAYIPMRVVGRLTAPVMCCMLAEGYRHTSSLKKYFTRLAVFAVISQIPYSLAIHGTVFEYADYNMLVTLTLSLAALTVFDKVKNRVLKFILPLPIIALTYFCDWGITAPLYVMAFYMAGNDRYKRTAYSMGISIVYIAVSVFTRSASAALISLGLILAPILLYFYSGARSAKAKSANKWVFYVFYPAHLMALALINLYII